MHHAIHEFIEHGYHGARMQNIAERAKVNKALIFYYYTSKDQIYKEVLGRIFKTIFERLNNLSDEPTSVENKVRQIVDVYMSVLIDYPDYIKLMMYELSSGANTVKELNPFGALGMPFSPMGGKIYSFFDGKIRAGEMKQVDIIQLIISIVGQIIISFIGLPIIRTAFESNKMDFDIKIFLEKRKDFIVNLVINGIKPEEKI